MDNRNKISAYECIFLDDSYFDELFAAFVEAYSDYVIPFGLTETQFRNHIALNAVDLTQCVGCMAEGRLVGFSLNGFGEWHGKPTVYDAGTGVVPAWRRNGFSESMFAMMLPRFKESGIHQCLLEAVTSNAAALNLYQKLGFQTVRNLALLQHDGEIAATPHSPTGLVIREIAEPDWPHLLTFSDGKPSWQNSVDAINRSRKMKHILGAFDGEECLGYIVFSSKFGRVAQIAVKKNHRKRGIGTALVRAMQSMTAAGFSLQVINIDKSLTTAIDFFLNRGFYERLVQYEMIAQL